jgi:hypothetical protein
MPLSVSLPSFGWKALAWVVPLSAVVLAGCTTGVVAGDPALPEGFEAWGAPNVELNAYFYAATGNDLVVPADAFRDASGSQSTVSITTIEAAALTPAQDYGLSLAFASAEDAALAYELIEDHTEDFRWIQRDGASLMVGAGEEGWAEALRVAWLDDERLAIEEQYGGVWEVIRLLPQEAPATPVAAGFVRSVPENIEDFLALQGVDVPRLADAFEFIKVEEVAFVVYSDDLDMLPVTSGIAGFRELDVGVVAVVQAGYPGFVVDLLLGSFANRIGLETVKVEGRQVRYRGLDGEAYLMMVSYGSSLFFALSPTREGVEELIRAVIANQG